MARTSRYVVLIFPCLKCRKKATMDFVPRNATGTGRASAGNSRRATFDHSEALCQQPRPVRTGQWPVDSSGDYAGCARFCKCPIWLIMRNMGLPVEKPWFTVADYLRRKREAGDKHEHRN